MAITATISVSTKTVEGDHRKVYGTITLSGTYETGGFDLSASEMSDDYFTGSSPSMSAFHILLSSAAYLGNYTGSKFVITAPNGTLAHTHTIAVAEGTDGTAMTLDDATGINVNDATDAVDITTEAATQALAGAVQVANGTDLTGMVISYWAVDLP